MEANIITKNMTVEFPIYENSHRSLKKKVLNMTTGGRIGSDAGKNPVVRALDDINLTFSSGDRVGLVGHNGSGKTTLLRVLTGVYSPVKGEVKTLGRIASLLDVSMGLDPDATGFENIYLKGVMDGLNPEVIRERVDEIAEFTELGEYLNLPVKTYSSGMMLRLAFSISTSVDADIIIMDEWLSVGDESFNKKASERLNDLIDSASILVIASHDAKLIENVCNRKIYMEHGRVVSDEHIDSSLHVHGSGND
ncbi:ABC transporter ATP-binding protein [Vibrio spartinae]|uniref:Teichoic acids export ATP-binding protein TagH n=1 Tax=Vibrio spartinae TaxID=1918945 RepID=A0ABX6QV95_9VIBR|nr:ABC transporter ATP-binding protein [Vibrio spartinae]QMV12962.1 Teichoic acids export ATP-binding protein TagH [Vibrio spartinae]